jgi:hypothetical protein
MIFGEDNCRPEVEEVLRPVKMSLRSICSSPPFGWEKYCMLPCLFLSLLLAVPVQAEDLGNANPLDIDPEMKQFLAEKYASDSCNRLMYAQKLEILKSMN